MELEQRTPGQCVPCAISKMFADKFITRNAEQKDIGDPSYAYLMFFNRPSVSGFLLAAAFVDAFSNYIWVFPL
jgi:hypothetical protein